MAEDPVAKAQSIWTAARKFIIERNPDLTSRQISVVMSIRPTMAMDSFIVLSVANTSSRSIIENELDAPIRTALSQAAGLPMTYAIRVKAEPEQVRHTEQPQQDRQPEQTSRHSPQRTGHPRAQTGLANPADGPSHAVRGDYGSQKDLDLGTYRGRGGHPARQGSRQNFIQPELQAEFRAEQERRRQDVQGLRDAQDAQNKADRYPSVDSEIVANGLTSSSVPNGITASDIAQETVPAKEMREEEEAGLRALSREGPAGSGSESGSTEPRPSTSAAGADNTGNLEQNVFERTDTRTPASTSLSPSPSALSTRPIPAALVGRTPEHEGGNSDHQVHLDPDTQLNLDDTFDNFVPGDNSRFARAAAIGVAEQPGTHFNPLFIWGDSGLGKTHLLNAIGNYSLSLWPNLRVRYISSEQFTNEFIEAVQNSGGSNNSVSAFNHRYRDVDMLLIDDIQFLGGKIGTLETFFHTFNALYNRQKQIVIASDVQPHDLKGFDERIRSRFEMGLTVDVQPPDQETRIAILRMKVQNSNIKLSVPDSVLQLIAQKVTDNIRELEGALTRVLAMASLNNQPVTMQLAEQTLQDYFVQSVEVTPTDIITRTATYFGLEFNDLVGSKRSHKIATARQIAMYLCREMTGLSLSSIGEIFGGRDHTTVIHAYQKISNEMAEKREIYNYVTTLSAQLKQGHTPVPATGADPAGAGAGTAVGAEPETGSASPATAAIGAGNASASDGARATRNGKRGTGATETGRKASRKTKRTQGSKPAR